MPERDYLTVVELPEPLVNDRHGATFQAAQTWLTRAGQLDFEPILDDDGVCHLKMNKIERDGKHYVKVMGRVRHG